MKITLRGYKTKVEVEAEPLNIRGFPNLAIHRTPGFPESWTVTETTTGLAVVTSMREADTRKDVIKMTRQTLKWRGEEFAEAVANEPRVEDFYE